MKRSKRPEQLAKNASKLHKRILELLSENTFRAWEIRQEYPVNQVNTSFPSGREKYDVVILSPVKLVIEIHGEQHEKRVCFGGIDGDTAKRNLRKRQEVDDLKEKAAREAGWGYLVVWYYEAKITSEELLERILTAAKEAEPAEPIASRKPKPKIVQPKEYKWPKKKIPGRKFNGEPIK